LRELAPHAMIRSGDYPRQKGEVNVTLILSQLSDVNRITEFYYQLRESVPVMKRWEKETQAKLRVLARDPRGGGIILFDDLEIGKSISFQKKGKGQQNTEYLGHQFLQRQAPIPDWIIEQSFDLGSVINWESDYDEMYEVFYQTRRSEKPAEQTSAQAPQAPVQEPERPAPVQVVHPAPVAEEPSPVEESPIRETPVGQAGACPSGGTFGLDIDKLDHCAQCELWDDCDAENVRIKKEAAEPKPEVKPKLRRRANA